MIRLLAALLLAALACIAQPADELLREAVAMARAGRLEDARRTLEDGRRRFPADPRFTRELAGVSYRSHDPASARGYLRAALRQDPADSYTNEFLASLYLLDENLPAALKYWNRAGKPLLAGVHFTPEPPLDPLLRARVLAVSPGQLLTPARLDRTEANLRALDLFRDCSFRASLRDDGRLDLEILVPPKAPAFRGWPGRLLAAARGLPYRQVHLDTGAFHSLWRWDPWKRRAALDFSVPVGDWRLRWVFDARDEIWELPSVPSLRLRKLEAGADLARNLTASLRWTVGARLSGRRYRGGDPGPSYSGGWSFEIQNRFDYPLFRWPEHRLRIDSWGQLGTGQVLTAFRSRLVTPEAGLRLRWLPQARGDHYQVLADLRTGARFGDVPLDQWFMLGMERDNDLWLRGHVGTHHGRKGNAPMGTRYMLARAGLDRTILRLPVARLSAGPFFDLGRIAGPLGSKGWLYDTGLQLKLATFAGVTVTAIYGRSLRDGRGVFYTAVSR